MARKIKFPLDMGNNIKVHTFEELQKNFSINEILKYFNNNLLMEWLSDRFLYEEANSLYNLKTKNVDVVYNICRILNVQYDAVKPLYDKINKIKEITTDESIISKASNIALNQKELDALWDCNISPIYLYGDDFKLTIGDHSNIELIGILNRKPHLIIIDEDNVIPNGISFKDVDLEASVTSKIYNHSINTRIVDNTYRDKIIKLLSANIEQFSVWYIVDYELGDGCRINNHVETKISTKHKNQIINKLCPPSYNESDILFAQIYKDLTAGYALTSDCICAFCNSSKYIIFYKDIVSVSFGTLYGEADPNKYTDLLKVGGDTLCITSKISDKPFLLSIGEHCFLWQKGFTFQGFSINRSLDGTYSPNVLEAVKTPDIEKLSYIIESVIE